MFFTQGFLQKLWAEPKHSETPGGKTRRYKNRKCGKPAKRILYLRVLPPAEWKKRQCTDTPELIFGLHPRYFKSTHRLTMGKTKYNNLKNLLGIGKLP